MHTSPIITKALIDSRQRDLLAQARQARLVAEARLAAPAPAAAPGRRVWFTLRLPVLRGAH
jgi:hypothetical protein